MSHRLGYLLHVALRTVLVTALVVLSILSLVPTPAALAQDGGALDSTIPLQMPFIAGETWTVGGAGYFYGEGGHTNANNDYYATDWNRTNDDGATVLPVTDGTVASVDTQCAGSYGCYVEINHPNGYRTRYAHLSQIWVVAGQKVYTWNMIGQVGSTGNSTGPHLHLRFQRDIGSGYRSKCWNNGVTCPNTEQPEEPQGHRPSPMTTASGLVTLTDGGSYTSVNGRVYLPDLHYNHAGWNSEIHLFNSGQIEQRTVTVYFYTEAGSSSGALSCVLSPNQKCIVQASSLPSGTRGSALVDGGESVDVVVNHLASSQATSYNGVLTSGGIFQVGRTIYTPLSLANHSGWHTLTYIQNTGSTETWVTIEYYDLTGTLRARSPSTRIGAGASVMLDANSHVTGDFGGSAIVTSTSNDIAIIVAETNGAMTGTYNGVASGAKTVRAPLALKGWDGWTTGIQVQNMETVQTSITVYYYDSNGGSPIAQQSCSPNGLGSCNFVPPMSYNWSGALSIIANGRIAVEADEWNSSTGDLQSYNGLWWSTDMANMPDIRNAGGSWCSGLQVENAGDSSVWGVLLVNSQLRWSGWIPQNGWKNFGTSYIPASGWAATQGTDSGSGKVPIVAVVDNYWATTGDMLMSYVGINR